MLKYLYMTTEYLLITVTLITLVHALMSRAFGRSGRRAVAWGIAAGALLSGAVTATRNVRDWNKALNKVMNINQQSVYVTYAILVFTLLFIVLALIFARRDQAAGGPGAVLTRICAGCLAASLLLFDLPSVLSAPLNFDTMGNGTFSQQFFLRMGGWTAALLLMLLYSRWLHRCALRVKSISPVLAVLALGLIANEVRMFGMVLRFWTAGAKWMTGWPKYTKAAYPWAFPLAKFASSGVLFFSAVIAGLALLLPIRLFFHNTKVHDRYDNPAQLRKLRATARKMRRLAVKAAAAFALSMVCLTAVKAYANRTIELSPPETYTVEGDRITVPLEQVNDGHLHRFEYTTPGRVNVRWIVVRKPGGGSYGVGLDACDVCGNAVYYERGSQVVCKRCDVVMNINTIGFKGGCNPIPLAYSIEEGKMVFQLEDILAGEVEFKY